MFLVHSVYVFDSVTIELDRRIQGIRVSNDWITAGFDHLCVNVSLVRSEISGTAAILPRTDLVKSSLSSTLVNDTSFHCCQNEDDDTIPPDVLDVFYGEHLAYIHTLNS